MVARIDQQKRQLDLLQAFARAEQHGWKLALAGGADYGGDYARAVLDCAREIPGVVMLGHQSGEELAQLYAHAGVFVLPSSHEGQPIAVLEALSYGCTAIMSDIPAHQELALPGIELFPVGDIASLADRLQTCFRRSAKQRLDAAERERVMRAHDWEHIPRRRWTCTSPRSVETLTDWRTIRLASTVSMRFFGNPENSERKIKNVGQA